MATEQRYVLFENASGYSILLVKEFDGITTNFSAHAHSFLKPIAFVPFNSLAEALDNVQSINEGRVSALLSDFLRQNMPVKDAVLGVVDQTLGEAILNLDIGFGCIWDSSVRELLRVVRANSSRLLRSLVVQPGSAKDVTRKCASAAEETASGRHTEKRTRLVVSLSRARLQLDLIQHLADTGVVRSLDLLDSMDASLCKSMKHLRSAYGLHFPEICCNGGLPGMDDYTLVSIVAHSPQRDHLVQAQEKLIEWTGGNQQMADTVISLAKTSTGQDLSRDDITTLQQYGQFLLRLLKSRTKCCAMLERRVRSLVPNLTALLDAALPGEEANISPERVRKVGDRVSAVFVVARLLSHAVNLDRLAKMPSSRVNSLGASKSLFRQSGAVAAASAGLLGRAVGVDGADSTNKALSSLTRNIVEMSGGRLRPIVVRRRVARLLAAKSTLACRADCYRRMNPFNETPTEPKSFASTPKLDTGEYGTDLGEETKRQLRVWAEANGVHVERTVEELEVCLFPLR
ncbi:unnamed protein product [Mesocestoides corti]|uniref:Nucleolar protein 56 n=1 Tax=Mesocestoides corti TaxID=53468 RepID=A0A0R3U4D2_MESCO|nr:unnamed protein product [Mesocestoides corti]